VFNLFTVYNKPNVDIYALFIPPAVFTELKVSCTRIGEHLQPIELMTDFETGVITAVSRQFQQTLHKGCHFHFSQASDVPFMFFMVSN
jgi:hypothetical protein